MILDTHRRGPLGSILVPAALGAVIVTFLTLGFFSKRYSFQTAATSARPSAAAELIAIAARAGLDPDALAAAGVPTSQYAGILGTVRDYTAAHPTAVSDADTAVARAQRSARLARHPSPSPTTEVTSAMQQREVVFQAVFDAGTSALTADQRTLLQAMKTNKDRRVPLAYRTVARSVEEWSTLQNALADEAIATREHRTTDASVRTTLATARANSAVASALARLANGTAASRSALSNAAATVSRTR